MHELINKSSIRSASSAWRHGGGCSVEHIEAGEYFSAEGEGESPASEKALQEHTIYTHRSDQHRDEHERNSLSKRKVERA